MLRMAYFYSSLVIMVVVSDVYPLKIARDVVDAFHCKGPICIATSPLPLPATNSDETYPYWCHYKDRQHRDGLVHVD